MNLLGKALGLGFGTPALYTCGAMALGLAITSTGWYVSHTNALYNKNLVETNTARYASAQKEATAQLKAAHAEEVAQSLQNAQEGDRTHAQISADNSRLLAAARLRAHTQAAGGAGSCAPALGEAADPAVHADAPVETFVVSTRDVDACDAYVSWAEAAQKWAYSVGTTDKPTAP